MSKKKRAERQAKKYLKSSLTTYDFIGRVIEKNGMHCVVKLETGITVKAKIKTKLILNKIYIAVHDRVGLKTPDGNNSFNPKKDFFMLVCRIKERNE